MRTSTTSLLLVYVEVLVNEAVEDGVEAGGEVGEGGLAPTAKSSLTLAGAAPEPVCAAAAETAPDDDAGGGAALPPVLAALVAGCGPAWMGTVPCVSRATI